MSNQRLLLKESSINHSTVVNEYFMDSLVFKACFSRAYPFPDFHAKLNNISDHKG